MKVSTEEVVNAILHNDTARAAEMLERFGLTKDGTPPCFTSADKALVTTMLSFASAMALHDDLADDLAKELIDRTAMTINVFPFLRLVMAAAEIKQIDDSSVIPEKIRTALSKNDYTDKIAYAIEKLDDEAFEALIAFLLTGEIERLNVKFNLSIVRHIYAEETIPADLMFAYMGLCPRETIDDDTRKSAINAIRGSLGVLGGLTLLDALIGRMCADKDGEDAKPDSQADCEPKG